MVAEARETSEHNTVAYNMGRSAPHAERLLFAVTDGARQTWTRARSRARC